MSDAEDKESLARANLPFRAEYCKSNRAKCKKCQEPMLKDSLKLAKMKKSHFHDGYDAEFYHVPCFYRQCRPQSVADIRYFETLKFEDQKMLEKAIETDGMSILKGDTASPEKVSKHSSKSKSKNGPKKRDVVEQLVNYDDFMVEYAASSRAKCRLCEDNIIKDTVRICKLDYTKPPEGQFDYGPSKRWHHVDCFVKAQEVNCFYGGIENVPGFDQLESDDRKMLKKVIRNIIPEGDEHKKVKKEVQVKSDDQDKEEERLLKKQSDRFYALREEVSKMKLQDIEETLKHMGQKHNYKASNVLIDMATDVLLFGPVQDCPECKKNGTLQLRGTSYICAREKDSDTCTFETREPKRDVPDVPEHIVEKYPFFYNEYRFKPGKRIFPKKLLKAVEQKEAENNNVVLDEAPLSNISIGVISWGALKNDKTVLQKRVTTMGGKMLTALDRSLFVILTNPHALEKDTPKIEVAKALDVPFATDDWILKIKTSDDVVKQLSKCLIGEWAGDLEKRYASMLKEPESQTSVGEKEGSVGQTKAEK